MKGFSSDFEQFFLVKTTLYILKNKYGFQIVCFKKLLDQLICLSLKTKDVLLKTKDGQLKTKDGLLKTEDVLLKTKDSCTFSYRKVKDKEF